MKFAGDETPYVPPCKLDCFYSKKEGIQFSIGSFLTRLGGGAMRVFHVSKQGRGAVAQSVERPSKVPVWCNSTMGSNHESIFLIMPWHKVVLKICSEKSKPRHKWANPEISARYRGKM